MHNARCDVTEIQCASDFHNFNCGAFNYVGRKTLDRQRARGEEKGEKVLFGGLCNRRSDRLLTGQVVMVMFSYGHYLGRSV